MYLACTRFNTETLEENRRYRETIKAKVFYGVTLKIRHIYYLESPFFVIEMNNDSNRIEGIGLIRNKLVHERHRIYKNEAYNRFIYKGKYHLTRQDIAEQDAALVESLEKILFKGKSHLKCRTGITVISAKLCMRWNESLEELKQRVKKLFVTICDEHVRKILGDVTE